MDRMTTPGNLSVLRRPLRALRANWPALLLPLVAAGTFGLTASTWQELVIALAVILTVVAPRESAGIAPYALFAYGGYGLYLMHSLLIREANSVTYGFVRASWHPVNVGANWYVASSGWNGWVLTEAAACLAAGVCLLARTGSPGGGPVRRAVAQLRGTDGQPKTVPPLLLIGVIFLWEELFGQDLWFGTPWQPGFTPMMLVAILIVAAGVAAVVWLPRAAAVLAVAGTVLIGLVGVVSGVQWLWHPGSAPVGPWSGYTVGFYGAVPLDGGITRVPAGLEGVALVAVGCLLAPRLFTWSADFEQARRRDLRPAWPRPRRRRQPPRARGPRLPELLTRSARRRAGVPAPTRRDPRAPRAPRAGPGLRSPCAWPEPAPPGRTRLGAKAGVPLATAAPPFPAVPRPASV
jgi:hypothetical protein